MGGAHAGSNGLPQRSASGIGVNVGDGHSHWSLAVRSSILKILRMLESLSSPWNLFPVPSKHKTSFRWACLFRSAAPRAACVVSAIPDLWLGALLGPRAERKSWSETSK